MLAVKFAFEVLIFVMLLAGLEVRAKKRQVGSNATLSPARSKAHAQKPFANMSWIK